MKLSHVSDFLLSHFVGACASFLLMAGVPIVLCIIGIIIGQDAGGPMFLPMFLMFCGLFSALACAVFFAVTVVFRILYRCVKYPQWVPVAVVAPVVFTIVFFVASGREESRILWLILSVLISAGFSVYWLSLLTLPVILRRVRNALGTK